MSKYSFRKSTKKDVEKMREMYKNGNNFPNIARFFGIDHTSVMYWMGRLKRKPKDYESIKNLVNERKIMEDEKINEGKSYQGYVDDKLKEKLAEEEKEKIYSEEDKKRLENNKKIKERLYRINSDEK